MSMLGTPTEGKPTVENTQPPVVNDLPEFLKGIDPELAAEPMLKNHKDMNTLVKSYIHAQKAIGKDKIVKPTAKSSAEEWENAFKALGKPEKLEEYGIDAKKSKLGEETTMKLLEVAHKNHLLPSQVKALVESLEGFEAGREQANKSKVENLLKEGNEQLKKEWGNTYDTEMIYTQQAVKEFTSAEEKQYLKDTGMEHDPMLIKIFNKIGKAIGDDVFKGEGSNKLGLTHADIDKRIGEIRSNPALYDKSHADHGRLVKEMNELYEKKF